MFLFCFVLLDFLYIYLQVQWVEEQYNVFPFILFQADFFEFPFDDSGAGELWCWFVQSWHFYDDEILFVVHECVRVCAVHEKEKR